jgi:hypothetical protein
MGNLKPIGSEKLTGDQKLKRIMEIARFNEVIPNRINETAKSEYSVGLADGNKYEIIRERQGYIIKKTISESETDYIEPMKNRKYYPSYSQALKRLNLVAGELNRLNENDEGVSLYGEQKKFTLKTPKPKMDMPVPAEVPSAPPAVPSPELPPSPVGDMGGSDDMSDLGLDDMEMDDMGDDTEVDTDVDVEGGSNEQVTFKSIQKLTGKLTQKIRTLDTEEGMTSEDIKYVINMVLSSFKLEGLSEEDREDILSKFEDETEDLEGDDMGGEDLTDDSEVEDIQSDMDIPMEGDMEEGYDDFDTKGRFSDYDDNDFEEIDINKHFGKHRPKRKFEDDDEFELEMEEGNDFGNGAIFDSIFGESKVDKVLSKYFEVSKKEITESKQKTTEKRTKSISEVRQQMKSVIKLTETIEQELASQKFLEENSGAKVIGLTNKKNLVIENKGKEFRVTPQGLII